MIDVVSEGSIITLSGPASPFISQNNSNSLIGQLRYSGARIEVYDGTNWVPMRNTVYLKLTSDAEEAIKWVMQKKAEEYRLKDLADKYPAVKDLKEKLDVILALVKEEEK
jgi:hypothetical protein